ncbi:hypothetical protein GCM10022402_20910 [Salinactinospora qingdaonensis]|uniref:Uncharacterized protein n=1 Tax=Salinactinospora qingdaonensis TaxID=702744 RepID=A0ABP7FLC8_9ACTN
MGASAVAPPAAEIAQRSRHERTTNTPTHPHPSRPKNNNLGVSPKLRRAQGRYRFGADHSKRPWPIRNAGFRRGGAAASPPTLVPPAGKTYLPAFTM